MSTIAKRTVSLPAEQSGYIDSQVASGAYASASEVIRAGLRALQERDAAVERWLKDEVASTYDSVEEDPSSTIAADEVFASLRRRHTERLRRPKP